MTAPVVYAVRSEKTSPIFADAFARGCHGTVWALDSLQPGPVALFGSPQRWALLQQAIVEGREWYYADHGYFGRSRYFRVTREAYQHDGRGAAGPERFRSHGRPVQPWHSSGSHILVCPNSDTYHRLFGEPVDEWITSVERELHTYTSRPIIVRWKGSDRPIAWDLRDCWAVVTFMSASALDALIAGVPVFVLNPASAAGRMGLSDLSQIETPFYPADREPFLWNLAAQQWTLDEIRSGLAWRALSHARDEVVSHAR